MFMYIVLMFITLDLKAIILLLIQKQVEKKEIELVKIFVENVNIMGPTMRYE